MLCPACWTPASVPRGSDRQDVRLVLDRTRPRQQRPVRATPLRPARGDDGASRRPRRRARGTVPGSAGRNRWRGRAGGLRQGNHRSFVAGAHHHGLAPVEAEAVDLAVRGGPLALGREDERGVVERAVLGPAPRRSPRAARPRPRRRPSAITSWVGPRSGRPLSAKAVYAKAPAGPELGKDHQIRAAAGATTREAARPLRELDGFIPGPPTAIWMRDARTLPPSWHSSRQHGPTIVTRKHCRGACSQRNSPATSHGNRSAPSAPASPPALPALQPMHRRTARGVP